MDWSVRRADARRNHERILDAAVEVFAEIGLSATIPQIAERAGVGKTTVYRSYPTNQAPVSAVAAFQIDWLRNYVRTASERDGDARQTLRDILYAIMDRLAKDRPLTATLPVRTHDGELFEHILTAAKEQGSIRKDVASLEVRVLLAGVSQVLLAHDEQGSARWRHYAELVLNALTLHRQSM